MLQLLCIGEGGKPKSFHIYVVVLVPLVSEAGFWCPCLLFFTLSHQLWVLWLPLALAVHYDGEVQPAWREIQPHYCSRRSGHPFPQPGGAVDTTSLCQVTLCLLLAAGRWWGLWGRVALGLWEVRVMQENKFKSIGAGRQQRTGLWGRLSEVLVA